MENKGFTMIELLTVIVLLSIIATITYVSIGSSMKNSKEKLYKEQINNLEKAGHNWVTKYSGLVDDSFDNDGNCKADALYCDILDNNSYYKLSFNRLYADGYLKSNEIKNPKNESGMPGCIGIRYNNNRYEVNYFESCISLTNEIDPSQKVYNQGTEESIKVVYMDPTDLLKKCTSSMAAANVNDNGTPTEIKDGCMKWYIYKGENGYYKMILDHSTTANMAFSYATETYGNSNMKDDRFKEINARIAYDTEKWDVAKNYPNKIDSVSVISAIDISNAVGKSKWSYGDDGAYYYFDNKMTADKPDFTPEERSKYAWLFDYTFDCAGTVGESSTDYGCKHEDNELYETYQFNNGSFRAKLTGRTNHLSYYTNTTTERYSYIWLVNNNGELRALSLGPQGSGIRPVVTIPKSWVK